MKTINLFIITVTTVMLIACDSKVRMSQDMIPIPVQTNFKAKYSNSDNPIWYLKDSKYEVEFNHGNMKKHVWFEGNGMYIKESRED